ncbi:hypothetical protein Cgig2_021036 [Carnegiea gigantea]|uniref:Uncharacterized protein n=1 Tax=Carnegiea gigantea TaxID=171969 RepID=A0A9Q1GWE5_9CARY|nr:hypothetical protein Cgig2_021036 [Carnegiea gigantea]
METTSARKTSSTSTTATKRRLKQEVRKNRNICTPSTSDDEQPEAPTVEEKQKHQEQGAQPSQPTHQEEGGQQQQRLANPAQPYTTASGNRPKFVLKKRKTMHSKNTAQESSENTITDCQQQPSEETDDTVEDTTYKMPPLGHVDESDSDDEILVKRIKKIKEGTKSTPKKIQLRVKNCVKSQPEKKGDVKKSPKPPVKSDSSQPQVRAISAKPCRGDIKHKKNFQSTMSPSGFVGMIAHFNDAQTKAIQDIRFGGFLYLQVIELPGDLCKWLVGIFDPYSVTLYISPDKRIEITPMDVHITLALPIGGRKVEEFYRKKPKDAIYNEVLDAWRED